jgi:hypothetical protein
MPRNSLQSLARLAVVRLGCRPYHHLIPRSLLNYYSLWWDGVGPINFYVDGKVDDSGDNCSYKSKVRIGENVFPLDDALIYAAHRGNLGLTELCKELGANNHCVNHIVLNAKVDHDNFLQFI